MPAHVSPPVPRKPRPAHEPACADYAPGHFTSAVRRHNWPPMFAPQYQRTREVEQSELSRINRERRVAMGDTGTLVGGFSVRSAHVRNDAGKCRTVTARGRA